MTTITLPKFVFFTGAPGSKWSGISQVLEQHPDIDTSDRTPEREYLHSEYSGHVGAYFGPGMELEARLDADYLLDAWGEPVNHRSSRIVKSHHWAYMLEEISRKFPHDWIALVWRENGTCNDWWHRAGGFEIKYPSYSWYENDAKMNREIALQNDAIRKFAERKNLQWSLFDTRWVSEKFGFEPDMKISYQDVYVTLWRGT
ncbi:MAG: hypothetical protein DHS20C01_31870 [marine bacterium B5-7]|nr:MAG: hypothetical protein DHS20C01_31870 [marine bacterium B5-7]